MHELSVAIGVVNLAEETAIIANADKIEKVELEIGELVGIEKEAFEYAWPIAVSGTLLEGSITSIKTIPGRAVCQNCEKEYAIHKFYDFCPFCESYMKEIIKGKELKLLSIEVN